nr:MAG TPA: hypothetical protein [Caudoviricetes sp.]
MFSGYNQLCFRRQQSHQPLLHLHHYTTKLHKAPPCFYGGSRCPHYVLHYVWLSQR